MSMPGPSPMPTLFVGDLPADCNEAELRMLFEPFGPIASIRMKRGTSGKDNSFGNRMDASKVFFYAFIKFENRQSAEMAHQSMEGFYFRGRTLRVGWASASDDQSARVPSAPHGVGSAPPLPPHMPFRHHSFNPQAAHGRTAQVHFSYLSKQLDFLITQAFLWEVFSTFGEVVEISLKKASCDQDMCIQNGYGFAHFPLNDEGVASALKAVNSLHQVTINQVSYDCSVSNQLKAFIARSPAHIPPGPPPMPMTHHSQRFGQYMGPEAGGRGMPGGYPSYSHAPLDYAPPPRQPYNPPYRPSPYNETVTPHYHNPPPNYPLNYPSPYLPNYSSSFPPPPSYPIHSEYTEGPTRSRETASYHFSDPLPPSHVAPYPRSEYWIQPPYTSDLSPPSPHESKYSYDLNWGVSGRSSPSSPSASAHNLLANLPPPLSTGPSRSTTSSWSGFAGAPLGGVEEQSQSSASSLRSRAPPSPTEGREDRGRGGDLGGLEDYLAHTTLSASSHASLESLQYYSSLSHSHSLNQTLQSSKEREKFPSPSYPTFNPF